MIRYSIYTILVGVLLSFAYAWKAYQGNFLPMIPITFAFMILMALGEFFRPPNRKDNTHVIIFGILASLIIFWGGHIRGYQFEKAEVVENVRESNEEVSGTDQEIFNEYIQEITGKEHVTGFTGYFRYLIKVGFDEEVRTRQFLHFSGGWVVLAWIQHFAMFAFGIWVVCKAVDPEDQKLNFYTAQKKKSDGKKENRMQSSNTVQAKKPEKNISDYVQKKMDEDGTVHYFYSYDSLAKFFNTGNKKEAQALVDYGIPPETKDEKGTPILFAMIKDRLDINSVIRMAKKLQDQNITDQHNNTILHMIGECHGNTMGYYVWYDERMQGRYNESNIKKLETLAARLIQLGAELDVLNDKEQTPLMLFAQFSSTAFFKWVMKHKPDIQVKDHSGKTALMYATLGGDSQLDHINLLIQAGADIRKKDKQGKSAFYYAARNGYVHTFWRLVEELDEKEKLPLFNEIMPEAVLSKNHDFIEELIQKGAKTSHQKKLGQTPLSSALFTRDKNILLSVLEAGAEVNPGNDGARSTLISAVNFLWPEGARIILEHGANYKNFSNNFTPYMALGRKAENGGYMHLWEELVEILEPLDIPVNQTDDWDCTALDYVCGARNLLEMKQCEQQDFFTDFLMDKGADPFRKSSEDGKSPMERALLKGLDNIVRIMKEKSA